MADTLRPFIDQIVTFWEGRVLLRTVTFVALSLILAMVTDWVLGRVVGRWAQRTKSDVDDEVLKRIHGPIFSTVLVSGLWLTARTLDLPERPREIAFNVLQTLLVILWLIAIIRVISLLLPVLARGRRRFGMLTTDTLPLFDNLAKVVLFAVASYVVIKVWEADVSGWLASAGIVGIAVGFAARDSLANLFAGAFIFADSPYKVGDFINLDTGERGMVTDIGLRSTRLLTRDDVQITIPNAVMGNAKIVNESGGPSSRFRIRAKVGVSYDSDIEQVRGLLLEIAALNPEVCEEPSPRVRLRAFGASSLDFELLVWVDEPVLRGRVLDEILCSIFLRFRQEGVEIPYTKQDLYIKELPRPQSGESPAE